MNDGSGWTRCARTLATGVVTAAVVAAGMTMAPGSRAAAASAPQQVVVRGGAGCTAAVAATITRLGGTVTRPLGILNGAAAMVPGDELGALRSNPCVAAVTPDGSVSLSSFGGYDPTADVGSLYNTSQMLGAQNFWKSGYTGKGVGVALIDTGVTPVQGLSNGNVVNGADISFDSQSPSLQYLDGFGHGTHMAGIIAGNDATLSPGAYASNTSQFIGMAPDAHIVNVKVADAQGSADVSQVIAGIDWAVEHAHDPNTNIRVINLSFGTNSTQSYLLDPLAFAAETAWHFGIVVVAAAGNGGTSTTSLTDPAIDPYLIAVGAADTNGTVSTGDDSVASFSSTGSSTRSPDVVAPGVHVESLRDPGSYIDNAYGSTATVATRFFLGSGTSQATAVTSGAAALVLSEYPSATPDQVKYLLTSTATPLSDQPSNRQGNGELNLGKALTTPLPLVGPVQTYTAGSGLGSLDGSRGSIHLVNNGVTLSGEKDIFGHSLSTATLAAAESTNTGEGWTDGTFNGSGWAGSGWAGSGWASATWTSSAWSGSGWAGSGWADNCWTGSGWAGSGWAGSGWAGSGWAGSGWAGSGWANATWS